MLLIETCATVPGRRSHAASASTPFDTCTFEEYLAACYLDICVFPDVLATLLRADPPAGAKGPPGGAKAAPGIAAAAWKLAEALCFEELPRNRCRRSTVSGPRRWPPRRRSEQSLGRSPSAIARKSSLSDLVGAHAEKERAASRRSRAGGDAG